MERVKSKQLFNFRPAGVIDEDILEQEKKMYEAMGGTDSGEMHAQLDSMPDEEFCVVLRGMMDTGLDYWFKNPLYTEAESSCNQSTIAIPTSHDGEYNVKVLVHSPKSLASDNSKACIIYAHGGGVVGGTAAGYAGFLSYMAVDCGVVVFNVDYRLAPETRCPNNVLDFYEAVKYVTKNTEDLGIDPARIALAGESGGGYICAAAMVHLARMEESHLVKLAMPVIPMLTDYSFTDRAAMTKEEAENAGGQQKIWRLIAGPKMESLKDDAILYPGKADEALLTKMPPTIVWESEFDFYITEATRFASRLRAAGRLLEFVVIPGAKHGSGMVPTHAVFKLEREAWRLAIQEYLLK